jgi:hypothetical protein
MTRRALLASGPALIVGGAAGVAFQISGSPIDGTPVQPAPPPELVAAAASESGLLSAIDGALAHDPSLRTLLAGVRADHVAHQAVLRAALGAYASAASASTAANTSPSASLAPTQPVPAPQPAPKPPTQLTRTQLRALELKAAAAASRYARALSGPDAAVLASISACEASHAELLVVHQ